MENDPLLKTDNEKRNGTVSPRSALGIFQIPKRRKNSEDEPWNGGTQISALPREFLLQIFSFLTMDELCQVSRSCSHWYMISSENSLWKRFFQERNLSDLLVHSHPNSINSDHSEKMLLRSRWIDRQQNQARMLNMIRDRKNKERTRLNWVARLSYIIFLMVLVGSTLFQYYLWQYFWVIILVPVCLWTVIFGVMFIVGCKMEPFGKKVLGGRVGGFLSFFAAFVISLGFSLVFTNFKEATNIANGVSISTSVQDAPFYGGSTSSAAEYSVQSRSQVTFFNFTNGLIDLSSVFTYLGKDATAGQETYSYKCVAPVIPTNPIANDSVYVWVVKHMEFSSRPAQLLPDHTCEYLARNTTKLWDLRSPFAVNIFSLFERGPHWFNEGDPSSWEDVIKQAEESLHVVSVENAAVVFWGRDKTFYEAKSQEYQVGVYLLCGIVLGVWLFGMILLWVDRWYNSQFVQRDYQSRVFNA